MKAEVSKLVYEGKQVGIRVIFISDVRVEYPHTEILAQTFVKK